MSFAVGYPYEVWSAGKYYFWVPMVAPFCGCVFGGFLYDLFIYTGPESPLNAPHFGLDRYFKFGGGSMHTKERSSSVEQTETLAKDAV